MQAAQTQVLDVDGVAPGGHEVVLERLLDAPRELVWQAWTESARLSRWCAPHGYSITHCEGEAREGGSWRTCMRSPEGLDHWLGGTYREVAPIERLAFTHVWDGDEGRPRHETLVTITLGDEGGRTRLLLRQQFLSSESSRQGHEEGWSESLERLSGLLRETKAGGAAGARGLVVEASGEREIVMRRSFEAPRELVWEALSRPEHIRRWWGSCGDRMTVCDMDFREGGAWRFVVSGPQGEHGFRGEYREIAPGRRLVQTFEWEEMPGHVSTETMTLDERDGRTTMTITCVFSSEQDRDGMLASGMEAGAGESYDRLAKMLAEQLAAVA